MYRKVIEIRNSVKNGTVNVEESQKTLEAIAEQSRREGIPDVMALANNAAALMSDMEIHKQALLDNLELLYFDLAEPVIEMQEKRMMEEFGYPDDVDIDQMRDNGDMTEHFTLNGHLVCYILDRWDNDEGYTLDAITVDAEDKIINLRDIDGYSAVWELCDILEWVDKNY